MTSLQTPPPLADRLPEHRRLAVRRYLRALGAGDVEAEDLTQDVLLIALRTGVPEPAAVGDAFLRGVARNVWLRTRRWWQRHRERQVAAAVEELWVQQAASDDGDGLLAALDACLEKLERRARTALQRHYRDGLTWDVVAAELGLSPNGIKTLAQRTRQALRTCIERSRA